MLALVLIQSTAGADRATNAALADGARQAQSLCYRLVHDDTEGFADCVRALALQDEQPSARRLGIEYFGWVGAMNSARLGMSGANDTAEEFLARFRATQAAIKVDDQALCASVPGDCAARLARIRQAETGKPRNASSR